MEPTPMFTVHSGTGGATRAIGFVTSDGTVYRNSIPTFILAIGSVDASSGRLFKLSESKSPVLVGTIRNGIVSDLLGRRVGGISDYGQVADAQGRTIGSVDTRAAWDRRWSPIYPERPIYPLILYALGAAALLLLF